jgi:hypothetical protein
MVWKSYESSHNRENHEERDRSILEIPRVPTEPPDEKYKPAHCRYGHHNEEFPQCPALLRDDPITCRLSQVFGEIYFPAWKASNHCVDIFIAVAAVLEVEL